MLVPERCMPMMITGCRPVPACNDFPFRDALSPHIGEECYRCEVETVVRGYRMIPTGGRSAPTRTE